MSPGTDKHLEEHYSYNDLRLHQCYDISEIICIYTFQNLKSKYLLQNKRCPHRHMDLA